MPLTAASFRRLIAATWLCGLLAACGGGGSDASPVMEGTLQNESMRSALTATDYPLDIYVPPASAGPRGSLPVVYVLDGESWFHTLVAQVEAARTRVIIVGIGTAGQRGRDFVPGNTCTPGGGGEGAYFAFLRDELIPHIERTVGGDPAQRAIFGHSHGGSFVLYAMFAQAPGAHTFRSYLASDASISCMQGTADAWEVAYAAANRTLPVRLHLSYATQGNYFPNLTYAATIAQLGFGGLAFVSQSYPGGHSGIVPQVLAEAVPFALRSP